MVFGDCIIKPGVRIDSKFGVYDYLVKQHFLSSREHTPKRQAAIVSDLIDPESFSAPFQLATAHMTGGDLNQASAYQDLVDGLNKYGISAALKTAFATAGHPLSANAQVVSANDIPIDLRKPPEMRSVWYVRDTSLPDGGQTIDLVYQIRDETDDGGKSTLEASAQLAVDSAYPSIPFQLFFDRFDDDAYWAVVGSFAGYADQGPYADQRFKDAYGAIQTLLDAGKWTDGTNDIAQAVNIGLINAGFDLLPDPLPPIQQTPDADTWLVPVTPPIKFVVEPEAAPDGSPLHTIIARVDLAAAALGDQHMGVIQARGRVPHTPGTEIAAYLDRYTADELATFMDYLRSRYVPAYAYYVDHALAAIERKRDFLTWMTAQPDFTDPLPAHLILRPGENQDLRQVAYDFTFNDNWIEVKQHSKYTATVQNDLFSEGSLADKLPLTRPYVCGTLPPDSIYFSRAELKASQSKGHEQYFAGQKRFIDPPSVQVDTGCPDFRIALAKWKELRDANAAPDVMQQQLEELIGEDGKSAWERMNETLEPLHMGTELWDMVFEPDETHHVEYRYAALMFAKRWVEQHVETEWLNEWLAESFGATAEIIDVLGWMKVPFDLWMKFAEAQQVVHFIERGALSCRATAQPAAKSGRGIVRDQAMSALNARGRRSPQAAPKKLDSRSDLITHICDIPWGDYGSRRPAGVRAGAFSCGQPLALPRPLLAVAHRLRRGGRCAAGDRAGSLHRRHGCLGVAQHGAGPALAEWAAARKRQERSVQGMDHQDGPARAVLSSLARGAAPGGQSRHQQRHQRHRRRIRSVADVRHEICRPRFLQPGDADSRHR